MNVVANYFSINMYLQKLTNHCQEEVKFSGLGCTKELLKHVTAKKLHFFSLYAILQ